MVCVIFNDFSLGKSVFHDFLKKRQESMTFQDGFNFQDFPGFSMTVRTLEQGSMYILRAVLAQTISDLGGCFRPRLYERAPSRPVGWGGGG